MATIDQTNSQGSKITTALNVGSGVDIQELATSLSEAELSPKIESTKSKITDSETRISALGILKSGISRISTALARLEDSSSLTSFSASSSDSAAVAATAVVGTAGVAGSYAVQASQLAAPTRIISNSFSSSSQSLNGGTDFDVVFNQGPAPGVNTSVSVTDTTPAGVVDAINTANIGISPPYSTRALQSPRMLRSVFPT